MATLMEMILIFAKESTVVKDTVQLLMEHGHIMELLLTVVLMEKLDVRETLDQLSYIQLLNVVEADLIQMATIHVVLKGAVLVLEYIKKMI